MQELECSLAAMQNQRPAPRASNARLTITDIEINTASTLPIVFFPYHNIFSVPPVFDQQIQMRQPLFSDSVTGGLSDYH